MIIFHHPRLFFDTVLKQIDEAFPDDRSHSQIEHHGLCPPKLIYDQAAGTGKSAAAVRKATHGRN